MKPLPMTEWQAEWHFAQMVKAWVRDLMDAQINDLPLGPWTGGTHWP